MVRSPERNYLRAWREHRHMTQAELAEKVDTTGAVISLLESGQRGLSDKWLRKLAEALGTRPGHLLEVHPGETPNDIMYIWNDISAENQPTARNVLMAFTRGAPAKPAEPAPQPAAEVAGRITRTRGRKAGSPQAKEAKAGGDGETP